MRRIYTFIILAGASLIATAQPRFVAETPQVRMSDLIFQTPKTVTFDFENKGSQPLQIREVHPSCGCIKVTWPEDAVAPRQKGTITVTYDAGQMGTFYRELAVYTNQQNEPFYLSFQGRVVETSTDYDGDFPIDLENVRLSSNYVEFDDVNRGDKPVVELQVANMASSSYAPQLMHLPRYLKAEYLPEEIQGGRVGRIRLTLDSEELYMDGLNQTSIYLARYMGDKVSEENEIVVSAILLPAFRDLTPEDLAKAPRIVLKEGEETLDDEITMPLGDRKHLTKTVTIVNTGEEQLAISSVQVFNRALTVNLGDRNIPPHGDTKLKITLSAKEMQKAKNEPRILLISNDPRQPKTILNFNVE